MRRDRHRIAKQNCLNIYKKIIIIPANLSEIQSRMFLYEIKNESLVLKSNAGLFFCRGGGGGYFNLKLVNFFVTEEI